MRKDIYVNVKHNVSNVTTSIKVVGIENVNNFLSDSNYTVYVKCRKCNNIHDVNVICQTCDAVTII